MSENKNQLATLDQKLAQVKSVKELFTLPEVKERFIKNYEATTGKQDGENRLVQEQFALLQILADKPDLKSVDMFYLMSAIVYAGTTGLSFRENKLYLIPTGNGGLKVQTSPAGKREMFEMMPNVEEAPEAIIVYKGDHFIHDKRNNLVKEHWTTEKTEEKNHLDNIRAAYQIIKYKNGTEKHVVVYHDDLVKAKSKSKAKSDASFWNEWPGEACKKVATNRAFRLYHKYPDNVVLYGNVEDRGDTTEDVNHDDVTYESQPEAVETVNEEAGEVKVETSGKKKRVFSEE